MKNDIFATIVWRIVGGAFIFSAILSVVVQLVIVSTSNVESLMTVNFVGQLLIWPGGTCLLGLIVILLSKRLGRWVTSGLDQKDSS